MSTTLTNGLKLPDKGSVDWYADMQSNYAILDGAVGTVAEHTTALSGKAPLVHTHTKSDVTDLFNSANTWMGNNSYTGMVSLNSSSDIAEQFKQKLPKDVSVVTDPLVRFNTLTDSADHIVVVETSGHWANYVSKSVTLKYKNDSAKQGTIDLRLYSDGSGLFYPQSPFECSLGNLGNQWKSVYAQSYYYNGVAWGLDKENVWSANNSFPGITIYGNQTNIFQSNSSVGEKGDASIFALNIQVRDKNHASWASSGVANIGLGQDNSGSYISFALETKDSDNTRRSSALSFLLKPTDNSHNAYFFPNRGGTVDLGTSTNKWKSFNGVNPGALSLPDFSNADPIDTRNWVASTPTNNAYTPSENGWLNVVVADSTPPTNEFSIYVKSTNFFASAVHKLGDIDDDKGKVGLFIPVIAGITYYVVVKGNVPNVTISATLYSCFGSV